MSESGMEIGRFYKVPCVKPKRTVGYGSGWLPVNGPCHEDAEFINFPYEHFHIDWRFVSKAIFARAAMCGEGRVHGRVINAANCDVAVPSFRRRRYQRSMPEFPGPHMAIWIGKLEEHYAGQRLNCSICPHRGIDLRTGVVSSDGSVICPGHGLKWNLRSGELIRRT